MKQSWLFLSLLIWGMIISQSLLASIFLTFIACVFHFRHFQKGHILFLILLIGAIFRIQPHTQQMPTSKIITIQEIKSSYMIGECDHQKVLLYNVKDVSFQDVIEVQGNFELIDGVHNPPEFYFPAWCKNRNIQYAVDVKDYEVIKEGTGLSHDLYLYIQSKDETTRSLLNSMLFGIRQEEESYLITSSGMHITTLWQMIRSFLSLFFGKQTLELLCFFGMGIHAYATVLSPTMLRVLSFQLIRFLFPHMDMKDRLGCSMFLILMIAPYMALELSFLIPVAFYLVSVFQLQKRKKKVISLLVLIPIQFFCMQKIDIVSILLFSIFRYLSACLYLLAVLMIALPIPSVLLSMGVRSLEYLSSFHFTFWYVPALWWLVAWGYALVRYISEDKKYPFVRFALLLLFSQFGCYLNPFGEIYMIDVGQGDCTVITLPFHQGVIMIDAMGSLYKDIPKDIILPVLQKRGIHKIDALIVTHEDYDHSGGVEELAKLIPIHKIITEKQKDIEVSGVPFHFLIQNYIGKDGNENSIITYFEMYDVGYMFMGDAGYGAEAAILKEYADLKVDVLKLGHHGSNTASSPSFIHHYRPKLALISAGRNNRYGHPHKEVLNLLKKEHVYPLITKKQGGISIRFQGVLTYFETADREFGCIHHIFENTQNEQKK